jgi:hypothetical protein
MIFLSVLFFTVIVNSLSIQEVSIQTGSRVFSSSLSSAFAQSPSPTQSPKPTQSSSQSPSPTQSPTQSLNPTVPSDNKVRLAPKDILILLIIVLIGALILLFSLLSPITGFLGFFPSKELLASKSEFLTETFPTLLQGVTVILIVMIVAVLTLGGWIESQGTISILSALIGYVLGRKATELEYANPPSNRNPERQQEKLTIEPPQGNLVKVGQKVDLKIHPPQEVEIISIDPDIGNAVFKRVPVPLIEYTAPPQANRVTITVKSKDNQQAEVTIDVVP